MTALFSINDVDKLDRAFPYLLVTFYGSPSGWHIDAYDSMEELVRDIIASSQPCFPALLIELQAVPCEGE